MDPSLISYGLIAFVVVQRITELFWANRNTCILLADGAYEVGAGHYPLFVMLHTAWLIVIMFNVSMHSHELNHNLVVSYIAVQFLRIWVLVSLGRYWTTRIIVVPNAPMINTGPYRWVNHPNYIVVACEIALLPLVYGLVAVAIIFSCLNSILLWRRINIENQANSERFIL